MTEPTKAPDAIWARIEGGELYGAYDTEEDASDCWSKPVVRYVRDRTCFDADGWTVHPETGRTNSSPLFEHLEKVIARIIEDVRVGGNTATYARCILAKLAHVYRLTPTRTLEELSENDEVKYEIGRVDR